MGVSPPLPGPTDTHMDPRLVGPTGSTECGVVGGVCVCVCVCLCVCVCVQTVPTCEAVKLKKLS